MHEEQKLIERVRRGDQKAFKELYDKNVVPLYRFMKQFSFDKLQVEDWVQRAFIKSYENINKFDGISLYSTWLFKIALNEMRMDYRRAGLLHNIELEEVSHAAASEDTDLQWNMVMKDWLQEISETKRMVFILYEVEGYSHSEISDMLGINESTSRTILTRTKAWLKNRWIETEKVKC
ncbi:MAG: RNA polymerase sigma factor [Bacillota bacterium]